MSFDPIIRVLRDGSDQRLKWAQENRRHAVTNQKIADDFQKRADNDETVARTFDLLADALATGQLTKDQLRTIVTEANLDAQAPVRTDGTYTDAQLNGEACADCGGDLTFVGARSRSLVGGPLFVHSNPDDCKAVSS